MIKKIKNIFYLITIFSFILCVVIFYLSERNVTLINKSRAIGAVKSDNDLFNLPLLKNDTNNIIEYSDDVEIYKKSKKSYNFWGLIKQ